MTMREDGLANRIRVAGVYTPIIHLIFGHNFFQT